MIAFDFMHITQHVKNICIATFHTYCCANGTNDVGAKAAI